MTQIEHENFGEITWGEFKKNMNKVRKIKVDSLYVQN